MHTLTNRKSDDTVIDSYSYTYDAANNQTSKVDGRGTTSYTYDDLNRLETVSEPSGKETSYTFDLAGNRATEAVTESVYDDVYGSTFSTNVTIYNYDDLNRLLSTSTEKDGVNIENVIYIYDNNGNQLSVTKSVYKDVYGSLLLTLTNMTCLTS